MLPLLQMHHMVQPSPNIDSLASIPIDFNQDYAAFSHLSRLSRTPNAFLPYVPSHRAFPIRTSQPAASSTTTPQPPRRRAAHTVSTSAAGVLPHSIEHSDHQLRRKTPNGTIDAGYDGSPTPLGPAPPPLKHMIVAAASEFLHPNRTHLLANYANSHTLQPSTSVGNPAREIAEGRLQFPEQMATPWDHFLQGNGASSQNAILADPGPLYHSVGLERRVINEKGSPAAASTQYQNQAMSVMPGAGQFSRPSAGTASVPAEDTIGSKTALSYHEPHNREVPSAHIIARQQPSTLRMNGGTYASHQFSKPSTSQHFHGSFLKLDGAPANMQCRPLGLDTLSLDSGKAQAPASSTGDHASRSRFREKVLVHAHRTYLDLLAHLHRGRKHRKVGLGNQTAPKVLVYPKPPRRPSPSRSPSHAAPPPLLDISGSKSAHHRTGVLAKSQQTGLTRTPDLERCATDGVTDMRKVYGLGRLDSSPARASMRRSFLTGRSHYPTIYAPIEQIRQSPVSSAKSALEMLNHLCEQTGWKWVDGMLLGGCLHYGLEHYEDALEWFSRIMAIDSR
jgi:hypothetical protein